MSIVRLAAIAAALSLAACQAESPPAPAAAPAAAATAAPAALPADAALAPPPAPPPAAVAEADDFVGWYIDKGGKAQLLACGQSVPLAVADPTFLRQLQSKRGGGAAPVYVHLAVSAASNSELKVVEVRQFGIDEGPAPNCPLPPPS